MKKALFIVNPNAGKMAIKENLIDILSKFNARGYVTNVYITQKPMMRQNTSGNVARATI